MKSISTVLLTAVFCLPTGALAQGAGDTVETGVGAKKVRHERRPEGRFEITENPNGTVTERLMGPDEAVAGKEGAFATGNTNGEHLCRVEAHLDPRRLAPGESGELKVLATLAANAVALPGKGFDLSFNPIDGFQFGTPVLEPAKAGTLEGQFRGKPVYDDYVLFRVPLTVAETVKSPAKHFLTGSLKITLHDGKTGRLMGEFSAPVTGRVEIGKSMPRFAFAAGSKSKAAKATKAAEGSAKPSKSDPKKVTPTGGTAAPAGFDEEVVRAAEAGGSDPENEATPVGADGADGGDDLPVFALAGGALAVLVLLLLVLVRRK